MQDNDLPWKQWRQEKYDGIKGLPPDWFPEPSMREFQLATGILSLHVEGNKVDYAEIKSRFDQIVNDPNFRLVLALSKQYRPYDHDLFPLANLYNAVLMGPEKGLLQLAGKNALKGYKSATAHQRRDDFKDKPLVQELFKQHSEKICSLRDFDKIPELKSYRTNKKYTDDTLRGWINEVAPGHLKRGAPHKK